MFFKISDLKSAHSKSPLTFQTSVDKRANETGE